MSVILKKKDFILSEHYEGSYFDKYINTEIEGENMTLSYDKLTLLMLPNLDIIELLDECSIEKDNFLKVIFTILLKLLPDTKCKNIFNQKFINKNYFLRKLVINNSKCYNYMDIFESIFYIKFVIKQNCDDITFTPVKI